MIDVDAEGKITCPMCNKRYTPKLQRIDGRPIQEQYPYAPPAEREELVSGTCQECQKQIPWDSMMMIPIDKISEEQWDEFAAHFTQKSSNGK